MTINLKLKCLKKASTKPTSSPTEPKCARRQSSSKLYSGTIFLSYMEILHLAYNEPQALSYLIRRYRWLEYRAWKVKADPTYMGKYSVCKEFTANPDKFNVVYLLNEAAEI